MKQHTVLRNQLIVLYKQTYIEIEYIFLECKITVLSNISLLCIEEYFAISVCQCLKYCFSFDDKKNGHSPYLSWYTCVSVICNTRLWGCCFFTWNIRVKNKLCLSKTRTPRAGRIQVGNSAKDEKWKIVLGRVVIESGNLSTQFSLLGSRREQWSLTSSMPGSHKSPSVHD